MSQFTMFVALAVAAAGASAETPPLSPTGTWVVDYADNMCLLEREYGTPERPLRLAFRKISLNGGAGLYVFDAPSGPPAAVVQAAIGDGTGTVQEERVESVDIEGSNLRYNHIPLSAEALQKIAASEMLTLDAEDRFNMAFQAPGLSRALKALDACTADLLDSWGFSRKAQARMATPPEPRTNLLWSDDYPRNAILKSKIGDNIAFVRVDRVGRASDCVVVISSQTPSLDDRLCRALVRARYTPAVDTSGQPMDSLFVQSVRWRLAGQ